MEAAKDQTAAEQQLKDAIAAVEAGDGANARTIFEALAAGGNAVAEFNLGVLYEGAAGIAANPDEAVRWYTQAAEHGNALAQFNLSVMYDLGRGVAQDNEKALAWLQRAAAAGNASAQPTSASCTTMARALSRTWCRRPNGFSALQRKAILSPNATWRRCTFTAWASSRTSSRR